MHGRLHAIWLLSQIDGRKAVAPLFRIAKNDPKPQVRRQAIRALADQLDPVLVAHRLDAPRVDTTTAERLAVLASDADPQMVLEVVVTLGRLRWSGAPDWLDRNLAEPDQFLAHAAQQTMRRSGNWPAVLKLVDRPDSPIRQIAVRALADCSEEIVVDGLVERLKLAKEPKK